MIEILRLSDCAKLAHVCRGTILHWVKKGYKGKRLRAEHFGKIYFVDPKIFDDYIKLIQTL